MSMRAMSTVAVGLGLVILASAALAQPVSVSKFFSTPAVLVGDSATLGLTLSENSGATDATGVAVADTFPSGLVIASPSNVSNGCGGTLTGNPGDPGFSLSGGFIFAGSVCSLLIDVTSTTPGSYDNATGPPSSNEGGTGVASNTANLVVLEPLTLAKAFGVSTMPLGGSTTLTFTIDNPGAAPFANIGFTDALPAGLSVGAAPPTGSCLVVSPAVTNAATVNTTSGSVSMSGLALAAASSCSFTVTVDATARGAQNNTTSAISFDYDAGQSGTVGFSRPGAAASVTVTGPVLAISKTHAQAFQQGDVGRQYTLTVSNVGDGPTSGTVTVTDTLPAGLTATAFSGAGWSCVLTPPLTCTTSAVALAGASFPPITLTVDVAPDAPASVTNVAQASGGGDRGPAASASDPTAIARLPVVAIPTLDGVGLAALLLALGVAGWHRSRRRSAARRG